MLKNGNINNLITSASMRMKLSAVFDVNTVLICYKYVKF